MIHGIEVSEDRSTITKYFENHELLELEILRSREAFLSCQNCEYLSVPRVISHDEHSITFRYYPNAITFSDLLRKDLNRAFEILPAVAKSLVYLKSNLKQSYKSSLKLKQLKSTAPTAYVHGDFSVHNLLVLEKSLLLVDWSSSHWVDNQFNHAAEHWDLIWFILGVYLIPPVHGFSFANKDEVAKTLLRQYAKENDAIFSEEFFQYALVHADYFKQRIWRRKPWYSYLKHYPEWYRCEKFWKKVRYERP